MKRGMRIPIPKNDDEVMHFVFEKDENAPFFVYPKEWDALSNNARLVYVHLRRHDGEHFSNFTPFAISQALKMSESEVLGSLREIRSHDAMDREYLTWVLDMEMRG